MKKALVSSFEPVLSGYRVAQVVDSGLEFEVSNGLIWIDCEDFVVADIFYYDPETTGFVQINFESVVETTGQTSGVESF